MRGCRILLVSLLSLFAGNALADTYIFITNSTPDPVTISVSHYGTRTLSQGSQWAQEASSIGPYETKRVLRYNRYWGVSRGHTFNFDTHITRNGSTVVAKQSMVGTWTGSNIKHGASGPGFSSPWYTNRNVHTFAHQYANRPSKTAFKAEFTGGYDDFYYVITNNTPVEPLSGADELKVLSYNIYALPFVASEISNRLAELPNHLSGYDVIMFQEAFSSDRNGMLQQLASEYPYQTHVPKIPYDGINVFDSGVLVISRYPIVSTADFIYPDCSGTDCFADKGVIYAEVIKNGKAYHVTNTHAASFDTAEARALRQVQFQQIRTLINNRNIPAFDAVMMGGDFNVNKLIWPQDYAQMLANLVATDPLSTGHDATFDPRINILSGAAGSGGETVEYLDYVVYSNTHRQPVQSRNDVRIPRTAVAPLFHTRDLSDHYPVMGEFVFAP
ncbi:MAG: phospholipase [Gammaproteobacteria bacterium HGW-Gammaproteobacteria-14]|nr:MAG: phospholipase [Gammaproteobacteria bacterium HGW-Gammaproteobacteria-14]